jgi:hypothetical protein
VRRALALLLVPLALVEAACASDRPEPSASAPTSSTPSATAATTTFCRRLHVLDDTLREVRGLGDATASVGAYADAAVRLDLAFRRMRDTAPTGTDLAPIEYANGRFGVLVREMPPDLSGPLARARVAIVLESYNAAMMQALVDACGPESLAP